MPPSDANKRPFYEPNASPGEIYKSIRTEDRDFEKGETKLVKSTVPAFVKFCKWTTQFIRPDMKERMLKRSVWKTEMEPSAIADAIVFLCSEQARYITGTALDLSGGISLFTF